MGGVPSACARTSPQRVGRQRPSADTVAIIVAGGSGERFGDPRGKQFVDVCGLPLMCWALVAFDRAPSVAHLVVVLPRERWDEAERDVLGRVRLAKPVTLASAGDTRQESVAHGLEAMPRGCDFVTVHDAVRPLVETDVIEALLARLREDKRLAGIICAARAVDTLKVVEGSTVVATPDRSFYWVAQTPQAFRTRALVAAHRAAEREGHAGTDDSSLVERDGGRVCVLETTRDNVKVTVPGDLAVAEAMLQRRLLGCCLGEGEGRE